MSSKLISDIRLFESDVPNVDGNSLPGPIGRLYEYDGNGCLAVIQRLLFLLRHRGFCYDGFDHLYLNVTPCLPHGNVQDVDRYTIREFSWYHHVDLGCDVALFNSWSLEEKNAFLLQGVKHASLLKASDGQKELFAQTFDEVLQHGAQLLLPYKRKENERFVVEVFTRIDDEVGFLPLIRVTAKDGALLAEHKLRRCGRDEFITQIGTISIGKHSVRISPRKNWYTNFYGVKPIKIEW